jgi:hypothetical protein
VSLGREKRFLIPAQKSPRGAKEGELLTSGAECKKGFRDRGHGRMMKQENLPWNIFLSDLARAGVLRTMK